MSIIAIAYSWTQTATNGICDVNNGEVKLSQFPGKALGLGACRKACIANPQCQAISYNNEDRTCGLYSTPCTRTVFQAYTDCFRLKRPTAPTATTTTTTTLALTPAPTPGTMHCVTIG